MCDRHTDVNQCARLGGRDAKKLKITVLIARRNHAGGIVSNSAGIGRHCSPTKRSTFLIPNFSRFIVRVQESGGRQSISGFKATACHRERPRSIAHMHSAIRNTLGMEDILTVQFMVTFDGNTETIVIIPTPDFLGLSILSMI
jgi:hypothetical protein